MQDFFSIKFALIKDLTKRTRRKISYNFIFKFLDSTATDFTDSTGIDLLQFVINTLHKNLKDREMLLSLETEMRKFVLDKKYF